MLRHLCRATLFILLTTLAMFAPNTIYASSKTWNFVVSENDPITLDRLVHKALSNLGYGLSITSLTPTSSLTETASGQYDGIVSYEQDIEKEFKNLILVPEPIGTINYWIYAKEDAIYTVNDWSELKDRTIAYNGQNPQIEKKLLESGATVLRVSSKSEVFTAVLEDRAELAIMQSVAYETPPVRRGVKRLSILHEAQIYTYLFQENSRLADSLANEYKRMKQTGQFDDILRNNGLGPKSDDQKIFLYIASSEDSNAISKNMSDAMIDRFSTDENAILYSINLNARGYINQASRIKVFADMLRQDFLLRTPDVIIISDTFAFQFMEEVYFTLFRGVPVVYCGQDNNNADMPIDFDGYFYQLQEKILASDTLNLMLEIYPNTKNIFVLNDYTPNGRIWYENIALQLKPYSAQINIVYNKNNQLKDIVKEINSMPPDTLVLSGFYLMDSLNKAFSQKLITMELCREIKWPIFEMDLTALGSGQVGGKYVDKYMEGVLAADIAAQIANGQSLSGIQRNTSLSDFWVFDYNALQELKIPEKLLPPNSILINKAPTLREVNPLGFYSMLAAISICVIFITALTFLLYRYAKQNRILIEAQKNLYTAEAYLSKDKYIHAMKERLEKIIDSAPVAYVVADQDGRVLESNAYARNTVGIYKGNDMVDFYRDVECRNYIMKELDIAEALYGQIVKLYMPDGDYHRFHVNLTSDFFEGQVQRILWGIDIEDSERRKDSLEMAQADMQKVLDTLPVPMCILDPNDLKTLYANHTMRDIFEIPEEVQKYPLLSTMPVFFPDGRETAKELTKFVSSALETNTIVNTELLHKLPHGEPYYVKGMAAAINYLNKRALVIMLQDVSSEKKREQMLQNLAEQEREANLLKNTFLANMSHEIRTPMNAIIGLSEIEILKEHDKPIKDSFKKISGAAKILLNIINDILDFSKMEANKMDIVEEPFELENVLSNALNVASQRLSDKQVEILLRLDENLPSIVFGDGTRLWQVLKNILDNSAKYTNKGLITLDVSQDRKVSLNEKTHIRFTIKDTGLGMAKEQVERLFSPFEQFHQQQVRVAGTGLGMSIAKHLIDLMGGIIHVESELSVGTSIAISIPFNIPKNSESIRDSILVPEMVNKRVLVLDDEPIACDIIGWILNSIGIDWIAVNTVSEALKAVIASKANRKPFDVIMVDYLLGNQEIGLDLARRLQEIETNETKLLMVSAYSKRMLPANITELGFYDFIDKPFSPSVVVEKLQDIMGLSPKVHNENQYLQFPDARVLLCEDNEINQEVAIGMLSLFSINPTIVQNGQECIELLEKQQFDIILMDIQMPVMDGHQATIIIRNSDKDYRDIPILAMTANAMKDEVSKCISEGMSGHIAKPIESKKLYEQISKFL